MNEKTNYDRIHDMKETIEKQLKGKVKIDFVAPLRLDLLPEENAEQGKVLADSFSQTTILQLARLCTENGARFGINAIRQKCDDFGISRGGGVFGRVPKSRIVPCFNIWYMDSDDKVPVDEESPRRL